LKKFRGGFSDQLIKEIFKFNIINYLQINWQLSSKRELFNSRVIPALELPTSVPS
jgi:hypothetical protein